MARKSRSNAEGDRLGSGLAILETLCQDTKGKDLRFGHGVIGRVTVRKNTGQLRYFRKPPAVVLAFALDLKVHGNAYFAPLLYEMPDDLVETPAKQLVPREDAAHDDHTAAPTHC